MSSTSQSDEEVITLQERTETDLSDQALTDEDYAALDEHDNVSSVSVSSEKVKIQQHIGHIGLPSGAYLEVLPKDSLEGFKLLYYLAKAGRVSEELVAGRGEIGFSVGESFIEVVGQVYAQEIERLLRRGIHKRYLPKQEATDHVKGQLRVTKQLARQEPFATSFESQYDELTADIPLNQLILYAAVELVEEVREPTVEDRLRRQIGDLQRIVTLPPTPPHPSEITLTRETQGYEPLVKFAEQILEESYIDTFGQQTKLLESLLINTETLFEEVVYSLVADVVQSSRYIPEGDGDPESEADSDIGHLLRDESGDGIQGMQPDIFLRDRGTPIWIADAKWKESDSPARNDLYQVTSYQRKIGGDAMIFYPEQGGTLETVYGLSGDEHDTREDNELRIVEVPLGGETYQEFEREARGKVREAMQAQLPEL
ncbi:McrC family protein [Halorubrum tebenquichense]|uniref:McrBC 5-methylcytosine restriction system component-like protein n=1 Tax=Halorubrum tebenquichense DSM 14210 TaxID=1227485 RepID=M0E227_9EURY|nr:McrBC 5-methylcytosine restriction system component-like protein [Halorubrum tebenquichense]ELZ41850.1 McrBC 5-methylcytosine restriction system component-like protein [Halorubrum tebenquichense DSM 14210]